MELALWSGALTWRGKVNPMRYQINCDILTDNYSDRQSLTFGIQWPRKLNMTLLDYTIMDSLTPFWQSVKTVRLNAEPKSLPGYLSLVSDLSSGSVGFVELTHPQTPYNKRGLILIFSDVLNSLLGYIPDQYKQQAFMKCLQNLKNVYLQLLPSPVHSTEQNAVNNPIAKRVRTEVWSSSVRSSRRPLSQAATSGLPCRSDAEMAGRTPGSSVGCETSGELQRTPVTSLMKDVRPFLRGESSSVAVDDQHRSRSVPRNRSSCWDQGPDKKHRNKISQYDERRRSQTRASPCRRSADSSQWSCRRLYRRRRRSDRQLDQADVISNCDSTNANNCEISQTQNCLTDLPPPNDELPTALVETTGNLSNVGNTNSTSLDHHNSVITLDDTSCQAVNIAKDVVSESCVDETVQEISSDLKRKEETTDFVCKTNIKREIVDNDTNHHTGEAKQMLPENSAKDIGFTFGKVSSQESSESSLAVLKCSSCNKLMLSGDIHLCHCRNVCSGCISDLNDDCDKCEAAFTASSAITKFYKRILNLLEKPCRNEAMGCVYTVGPGDLHEDTCSFEPVKCIACEKRVQKILLFAHFELEHPDKYLSRKNPNALIESFSNNALNYQIYYFLSIGEPVKITLIKPNTEEDLAEFIVEGENEVGTCISFRFTFSVFNMYNQSYSIKLTTNQQEVLKVPKDFIVHWSNGYSDLKISARKEKVVKKNETKTKNLMKS